MSARNLKSFHYSFVHSYICYGAMIWSSENKHKLQKIHINVMQNSAVRNVLNARFNGPSTPVYRQLIIPKFNLYLLEIPPLIHTILVIAMNPML